MVTYNSYPNSAFPCLVQVNYPNGKVGFLLAQNFIDGLRYGGKKKKTNNVTLAAIFKCKKK